MSTFHNRVVGALSSEHQRSRGATRTLTGITLVLMCAVLLVGTVDAAHRESPDLYEISSPSANAIIGPSFDPGRSQLGLPIEDPALSTRTRDAAITMHTGSDQASEEPSTAKATGSLPAPNESAASKESSFLLFPDSEVVNAPSAKDFQISAFVRERGGFLDEYREHVATEWMSGPEIVEYVAQNHSINPRLLLAIIEFRAGWISSPARPSGEAFDFPIRTDNKTHRGLLLQLSWTANTLSAGYYGWNEDRPGSEEPYPMGNAGTSAVELLLEELCPADECVSDFMATYARLFGDPWEHEFDLSQQAIAQPRLELPFPGDNQWILTGGPHGAWGPDAPWAALDFAPKWDPVRRTSDKEVAAVADAIVARVDHGIVVLDLDGDGFEQTGWAILYLHVVASEGITQGGWVRQGQIIGEASSAGGVAGGDHLHIARKYNGEWIPAVGPVPFELGSWQVRSGSEAYDGELYNESRSCSTVEFTVSVGDPLKTSTLMDCGRELLD